MEKSTFSKSGNGGIPSTPPTQAIMAPSNMLYDLGRITYTINRTRPLAIPFKVDLILSGENP